MSSSALLRALWSLALIVPAEISDVRVLCRRSRGEVACAKLEEAIEGIVCGLRSGKLAEKESIAMVNENFTRGWGKYFELLLATARKTARRLLAAADLARREPSATAP